MVLTSDTVRPGLAAPSAPANLCVIAEQSADGKPLIFTAFDALKGRGAEIARFETEPSRGIQLGHVSGWYPHRNPKALGQPNPHCFLEGRSADRRLPSSIGLIWMGIILGGGRQGLVHVKQERDGRRPAARGFTRRGAPSMELERRRLESVCPAISRWPSPCDCGHSLEQQCLDDGKLLTPVEHIHPPMQRVSRLGFRATP